MSQISGNTCSIITILPMGVDCYSINSDNAESQNGSIQLLVTGGTSPYTAVWSNGGQGLFLNNLQAGEYTATVTDFYGDYTESVTCVVGNNTFLIDEFLNCSSPYGAIYSTTINDLVENNVYRFVGVDGCYTYNDRIYYTAQTYSSLTVLNTYEDCNTCQPPAPTPPVQPTLCLSDGKNEYTFTTSGTDINNNFVWINADNDVTLSYNTALNRWEFTPWSNIGGGYLVQNTTTSVPLGNFINLGVPHSLVTWSVSEGECDGIPLSLTVQTNGESCGGLNDGSALLVGSQGETPYKYRIQNVSPYPSWSVSGLFNNLTPGVYIGEVSGGTEISSTTFTIDNGDPSVTYVMSLTYNIINNSSGSKRWSYGVQISPALPSTMNVTFDIVLTHNRQYRDTGLSQFSSNHTTTKNGTTSLSHTTSSTSTTSNTTSCQSSTVIEYNEMFTETISGVTMTNGDTVVGSVTQTVLIDGGSASCDYSCRMIANYITNLQIGNITFTGSGCDDVVNANTPVQVGINLTDCAD